MTNIEFLQKLQAGKIGPILKGIQLEQAMTMRKKGLLMKVDERWRATDEGCALLRKMR